MAIKILPLAEPGQMQMPGGGTGASFDPRVLGSGLQDIKNAAERAGQSLMQFDELRRNSEATRTSQEAVQVFMDQAAQIRNESYEQPADQQRDYVATRLSELITRTGQGLSRKAKSMFVSRAQTIYSGHVLKVQGDARDRMLQDIVSNRMEEIDQRALIASDPTLSETQRKKAREEIFGNKNKNVAGFINELVSISGLKGEDAAKQRKDLKIRIATDFAFALVNESDSPEITALRLESLEFKTLLPKEQELKGLLAELGPNQARQILDEVQQHAESRADDHRDAQKRGVDQHNQQMQERYNLALDLDMPAAKFEKEFAALRQWPELTREMRENLRAFAKERSSQTEEMYAAEDDIDAVNQFWTTYAAGHASIQYVQQLASQVTGATYKDWLRRVVETMPDNALREGINELQSFSMFNKYTVHSEPELQAETSARYNTAVNRLRDFTQKNTGATRAEIEQKVESIKVEIAKERHASALSAARAWLSSNRVTKVFGNIPTNVNPIDYMNEVIEKKEEDQPKGYRAALAQGLISTAQFYQRLLGGKWQ